MRVHKKIGGTNRLIEMFEKVNKIKINEDFKFPDDDEDELTPEDITGDGTEEEEETVQSDSPLDNNPTVEPDMEVEEPEMTDDTNMGTEEPDMMPVEEPEVADDMPPEESGVEIKLGGETPCDTLEGGIGDEAEVSQFNPEQVAIGVRTEMEHTVDPKIALEIALDHLTELPDYYTRLDAMEMEAGMEAPQDQNGGSEEQEIIFGKDDWVDSYKPVAVGDDITDEGENYPTPIADPEAGEEEFEFAEKAKQGGFEEENEDDLEIK